jgi:Nucleolar pre-ribosomal-associated protein 1
LIEAVDSQEAHQIASWRERPQIAMVLGAVQRSLVVRYAEDVNGKGKSTNFQVPELPGFSAIFLARASLVLSRPSDPLFLAMNRSFLRTEVDGGGFQDLTRLPAFMSLFCSSSDGA